MRKDPQQLAANIAKIGLVIIWGVFMYSLIKSHI
jgi:hypothetical protein